MCEGKRFMLHELRVLNNMIKRYIDNGTSRQIVEKATGTNGWIIGYINRNSGREVFQRDLEREFGITRSTASKVVDLMVKKGLIVRESVPQDARLKKLTLTPRAMELTKLMNDDFIHTEETATKGFSEQELDELFGYIERIKKNISERGSDEVC